MYQRILVATDLTEASRPALRHALALAYQLGAHVTLLHVTRPFEPPSLARGEQGAAHNLLVDELKQPEYARWGIDVKSIVRMGRPAETIVAMARELAADLIVVGTHGRTGVAHALVGSVAEKIMQTASCPVVSCGPDTRS